LTLPYREQEDVYLEDMPKGSRLKEPRLQENFIIFEEIRNEVLKHLEMARNAKIIGKSLEAEVDLTLTKEQLCAIEFLQIKETLHKVLIVSKINLKVGNQMSINVKKANGHVCARCWNVVDQVNEHGVCGRCENVLGGQS